MFDLLLEKSYKKVRSFVKNAPTEVLHTSVFKNNLLQSFELVWPNIGAGLYSGIDINTVAEQNANSDLPVMYCIQHKFPLDCNLFIIEKAIEKKRYSLQAPEIIISKGNSRYFLTLTYYYSQDRYLADTRKFDALDFFNSTIKIFNSTFEDLRIEYVSYLRMSRVEEHIEDAIVSELNRRRYQRSARNPSLQSC